MYRADIAENSRLFIISGRGVKEEVFREKFEQYGRIDDLWIVKDKRTNEEKGVVYITFSKASEAILAMEEMNGKILEGNSKPIKVIVASTKRDGSVRDPREDEKFVRLFVIIPKTYDEDELTKEFSKYGEVASVSVLRDKDTGNAKGFGYVRFHRAYHAALALEQCDKSFRPKFAEPKKPITETRDRYARDGYGYEQSRYDDRDMRDRDRDSRDGRDRDSRGSGAPGGYPYGERGLKRGYDDYGDRGDGRRGRREDFLADDGRSKYSVSSAGSGPSGYSRSEMSPLDFMQGYSQSNCQRLHITAPLGLTQKYLNKLFDLIPGLEYCDLNEQTGVAYARFQTPQCAAYAREKLDQFEYPIGSRLLVRFADEVGQNQSSLSLGGGGGLDNDSQIHQAAMVLERAGLNPDMVLSQRTSGLENQSNQSNQTEMVTYCNVNLPLPKPMMVEDTPVAQRVFIVCQPAAVPERILRDAFCRFGSLIDVYLLSGRNYGYAKYANTDSASQAMKLLHGQSIAGQRIKVLEAEPQKRGEEGHKRQRTEEFD